MKNSRNKLILVIIALGLGLVGLYLFTNNDDNQVKEEGTKSEYQTTQQSVASDTSDIKFSQELPDNISPPRWAQKMLNILNNSALPREQKIDQLVGLLKENNSDPQVLTDILVSLTALNPIEAADEIIPYLKNGSPRVQSAALGALNNASLLTEEEHQLKKALPKNDLVRKRIADAVNDINADPHTSEEVRQALISTYSSTNPSAEDSKKMNQNILSKDNVSLNEASYVATSVLNGKEVSTTLATLGSKDREMKDSVISSIGANLLDNPNVVSLLSKEQRKQIYTFISNNPPSTTNPNDFSYQNDQWKNTLNLLSNE